MNNLLLFALLSMQYFCSTPPPLHEGGIGQNLRKLKLTNIVF